jgi:hypothetical protein
LNRVFLKEPHSVTSRIQHSSPSLIVPHLISEIYFHYHKWSQVKLRYLYSNIKNFRHQTIRKKDLNKFIKIITWIRPYFSFSRVRFWLQTLLIF